MGSNIFAGTGGSGIYISSDNGVSWMPVNNGLTNFYVHSLAVKGSDIFAGTNWGVFLSIDSGSSWNLINNGLTNTFVNALLVNGTDLFAGTEGGVFMSSDNGNSWTAVNDGLTSNNILKLFVSPEFYSGLFILRNLDLHNCCY